MMPRRDPIVTGVFLILLGLGLFALQNSVIDERIVFFVIGGAFVAAYLYQRNYGFLIPGCVMMGLGLGMLAESGDWPVSNSLPFGLGVGFLGIYVIDRLYTRSSNWWPLFPAGFLLLVGLAPDADVVEWFFRRGWPLAIVILGVLVILRSTFGRAQPEPDA